MFHNEEHREERFEDRIERKIDNLTKFVLYLIHCQGGTMPINFTDLEAQAAATVAAEGAATAFVAAIPADTTAADQARVDAVTASLKTATDALAAALPAPAPAPSANVA